MKRPNNQELFKGNQPRNKRKAEQVSAPTEAEWNALVNQILKEEERKEPEWIDSCLHCASGLFSIDMALGRCSRCGCPVDNLVAEGHASRGLFASEEIESNASYDAPTRYHDKE